MDQSALPMTLKRSLYSAESMNAKTSSCSAQLAFVNGEDSSQHTSDADQDFAIAEHSLWMHLDMTKTPTGAHENAPRSMFLEWDARAQTGSTDWAFSTAWPLALDQALFPDWLLQIDRAMSNDPVLLTDQAMSTSSSLTLLSTRACNQSPDQLTRKRNASPKDSARPTKRTKLEQSSSYHEKELGKEVDGKCDRYPVFVRLEKVVRTADNGRAEFYWAKRCSSWVTVDRNKVDIRRLFEKSNRESLSVEVRTDGIGYTVRLSWNDKKQYYTGRAVDGKTIMVSDVVMKAMQENPLHGQFKGKRRYVAGSE